ncbi:Transcription initiation factor IIA, gamma subunit, helical domain protein [Oesophagostomum dentatum]|uniref:Transcription initiation factor IIA, gamma subunit, helical domain protein n=1 Tax=Oesophagostomum dentatum TaxID=61180 RepID=A0A0B1TP03_OESDE|nr:Transcription initiation factor IIA, gamma subunit, helical domain protein [Oesophagostomum dentatum]
MAYTMYRETTLGSALTHTLDDFVEEGMISRTLAAKVLAAFDASINKALAYRVKNKGGTLLETEGNVSRLLTDYGQFDESDVRLKIVACEAMPPVLPSSVPDPE